MTVDDDQLPHGCKHFHDIETRANLYLDWDYERGRWKLDAVTVDGYPLDERDSGAKCDYSHDDGSEAERECEALINTAMNTPMPTDKELLFMLADELGFKVLDRRDADTAALASAVRKGADTEIVDAAKTLLAVLVSENEPE